MISSDHIGWHAQPVVYILYPDSSYQRFDDTFDAAVHPIGYSPSDLVTRSTDSRVTPRLEIWFSRPYSAD
jgi:hypothetical protein